MTNKETIDRWATFLVPAVLSAESEMQQKQPGWLERLSKLKQGDPECKRVALEYISDVADVIANHMKEEERSKEKIEAWKQIIPAVFRAEDAMKRAKPEWLDEARKVKDEHDIQTAWLHYCREIATIIVKLGTDYEPDGSIDGENDYIENY